jgi:hypothetical protein
MPDSETEENIEYTDGPLDTNRGMIHLNDIIISAESASEV